MNKINEEIYGNDAFCILPWIQLHIATNGDLNACCLSAKPFGNINSDSLTEIWNGNEMNEFRNKMLNNIKDERCAYCHSIEASGGKSLRQNSNLGLKHHFLSISPIERAGEDLKVNPPVIWDIRFSNVCNFRCRTCYHGASSRWFEEAEKLGETLGDKPIIRAIEDIEGFYIQIEDAVDHVEEIYFAGGEPLIMDEHYRILEILENKGQFDKFLRYSTNFSTFKYKEKNVFNIWSKFKRVLVAASLDGSGKRGEFLRKEQQWDEILKNRELMKSVSPDVTFVVSVTVSAFNIFHIPDFHKELVSLSFIRIESFHVENMLQIPRHYSAQILPLEYKMKIKEKFEKHIEWIISCMEKEPNVYYPDYVQFYIKQFKNCIAYLFAADLSELIPMFVSRSNILDGLRKEKTTEVFPELAFMF